MIYPGNSLIPMGFKSFFSFFLLTMSVSFSSVVISVRIFAGDMLHGLICVYFTSGAVFMIMHHFSHWGCDPVTFTSRLVPNTGLLEVFLYFLIKGEVM